MMDKEEKAKHKLKYYDSASVMWGKCIIVDIILFCILGVAVALTDNCILDYMGIGTIPLLFVFIIMFIYTSNQAINNAYCPYCHKLVMDSREPFAQTDYQTGLQSTFVIMTAIGYTNTLSLNEKM